ncbi:MAG: acetyl-CoA carboxylase biotin carboxyl carrier protein subunit [Gelidibacter sp.]
MSKSYKAKVNDSFEFDIDSLQTSQLDAVKTNLSKYHVLKDHKTYVAEVTDSQFLQKTYTVKINNNAYVVAIHNVLDELIKAMGFEVGAAKKINDIKAPMPGLILDLNVKVGQEVKENDALLILEAMKMENVLTSPRDGIIKSISVKKGDAVEKNQLLIEFE